ncbi:MAG TPA: ABC transporter permease subunit [Polyangiaceae bacterium]|nr:ABC transporter permease subunit [Polyangiaceae bacterium]
MTLRRAARGIALAQLSVLLAAAVFGRWIAFGADAAELQRRLPAASATELLSWWAIATQSTAGIVLGASLVAAILGVALGASSVYGDNGAGGLVLRLVEFLGAVPALILAGILRLGDPSGGVLGLFASLALLRTLEVAQLVRAHVLLIIPSDFVEASRALGASRRWQLRSHVLPRLAQPLAVNLLLGAATLVGLEAALGFVGLGLPSTIPSWGGGLAALASGGRFAAVACVSASIGATCAALYGLAISLERRQRRAPGYAARGVEPLRELGAEGRGS